MGHMGNGVWGWGIWAMIPTGGMGTGVWGTGYGVQGVWAYGQRDTGVWAMGPMSDLHPKYQKDVKLSKRCQVVKRRQMSKIKHLDYGGGSQKN